MKSMDPKFPTILDFFKIRSFYDDVAPFTGKLNLFLFFHRFPSIVFYRFLSIFELFLIKKGTKIDKIRAEL